MNDLPPLDANAEDPWTYFGSYSRAEGDGAAKLLRDAGVVFEIKEEEPQAEYPPGGWSGPFALWVRDEHVEAATSLLVPFFGNAKW
jgi:hypothetical protein